MDKELWEVNMCKGTFNNISMKFEENPHLVILVKLLKKFEVLRFWFIDLLWMSEQIFP